MNVVKKEEILIKFISKEMHNSLHARNAGQKAVLPLVQLDLSFEL